MSVGTSSAGGGTWITSPLAESMKPFRIVRHVTGAWERACWHRGTRRRGASGVAPYITNPIASPTTTVVSPTRHSAAQQTRGDDVVRGMCRQNQHIRVA